MNNLHLTSLSIKGFRGIRELSIPQLSRVSLITGKNGVGKTTILEAVRIYARRGHPNILSDVLGKRDEIATSTSNDGNKFPMTDFRTLFHVRNRVQSEKISIGPTGNRNKLKLNATIITSEEASNWLDIDVNEIEDDDLKAIKVLFENGVQYVLPWEQRTSSRLLSFRKVPQGFVATGPARDVSKKRPNSIHCLNLGPGLLSSDYVARFWDEIALTKDEERTVQAFRDILDVDVERIAVVGNGFRGRTADSNRRILVKVGGHSHPVPLVSLGDGAVRLFNVAVALANSKDGFLVFDEAENGIHHSIQNNFWKLILRTAQELNVQVLATTHSWDCVRGFAQALIESEKFDGTLVRVEKKAEETFAVPYTKGEIQAAAEHGIEVR